MVPERQGASARCELCGGEREFAFTTTDRNRALSARRFSYERCRQCGTYALADVPDDLGIYYPVEYYGDPDLDVLERAAASDAEQAKLALIRAHRPGGRLIEIGPGGGEFSLAARHAGFEVSVIEMDQPTCERVERTIGVAAICSAEPENVLSELPPSDAVVLWHVLEHLPRPGLTLERIAANLAPGGVAAIAVPNPESLQFRLLRGRWAHVDAPRHLFLVPLAALVERAGAHGLSFASATSSDPAGRHWNRFGWEYAVRRFPAVRPSSRLTRAVSTAIELALSPAERRGLTGATYTALFVKDH
jgi:2-polyprenyl-3-methyl-5-hydroxy-6-metoxy-1,4-benzoquinol methylase